MAVFVAQIKYNDSTVLPVNTTESNLTSSNISSTGRLLAQQTFMTFMNYVAGISLKNYNITGFKVSTSHVLGSQKQQTCISAAISCSQSNLSIAMILIDGKVRFYDLGLLSGNLDGSQLSFAEGITGTWFA
jgi:hypothetical protein